MGCLYNWGCPGLLECCLFPLDFNCISCIFQVGLPHLNKLLLSSVKLLNVKPSSPLRHLKKFNLDDFHPLIQSCAISQYSLLIVEHVLHPLHIVLTGSSQAGRRTYQPSGISDASTSHHGQCCHCYLCSGVELCQSKAWLVTEYTSYLLHKWLNLYSGLMGKLRQRRDTKSQLENIKT